MFLNSCDKNQVLEDVQQVQNEITLELPTLLPSTLVKENVEKNGRIGLTTEQQTLAIQYEEIARQLALNMDNLDIREFISSESKKMYHGDYYFPLAVAKEQKIKGKTLKSLLASKNKNASQTESENRIDEIVSNDSKIIIGVPIEILKWNPKTHKLLVAASPVTEKASVVKAFDSEGKIYYLDGKKDPDVPVIIVGQDDRGEIYNNIPNNIPKFNQNTKNLKPNTTRVSGNYECISWLRCPNLNAIESFWFFGPELRFEGVVYNDSFSAAFNAFTKIQTPSRNFANIGYTPFQDLFRWYFDDNHGPDYNIVAFEDDDSGATQQLTVGVSAGSKETVTGTANYQITYKEEDKKIAAELLHYSSQYFNNINDSLLEIRIFQHE